MIIQVWSLCTVAAVACGSSSGWLASSPARRLLIGKSQLPGDSLTQSQHPLVVGQLPSGCNWRRPRRGRVGAFGWPRLELETWNANGTGYAWREISGTGEMVQEAKLVILTCLFSPAVPAGSVSVPAGSDPASRIGWQLSVKRTRYKREGRENP